MGKPLIGSRKHARMHAKGEWDADWELFASGSMRDVALHKPTGVVYKKDVTNVDTYSNTMELRNVRLLATMSFEHVVIPKASGFTIDGQLIIAMEYIKGKHAWEVNRLTPARRKAARELGEIGIADMHGGNYKFVGRNKVVPIDLGSPIRRW